MVDELSLRVVISRDLEPRDIVQPEVVGGLQLAAQTRRLPARCQAGINWTDAVDA